MLRALAAAATRSLAQQSSSAAVGAPSTTGRALAAFHSSAPAHGLDELFERPLKEGETRTAGRAWSAADLRTKSWDDLHALWYVLLKERTRLDSARDAARAARERPANPARAARVRKSMASIKLVLSERAAACPEPGTARKLRQFVDAL